MSIQERYLGQADHKSVSLYSLSNKNGVKVEIMNYGGIVTSVSTPDKNGTTGDIVLGFDNFSDYLKEHPYFGAICGRYANRIAKGRFQLNGQAYSLAINNGPNSLHGGEKGFDKVVWDAKANSATNELVLSYFSRDMEEGYPGNVTVRVIYSLTEDNELIIRYFAETDKLTHINLTNHSYFNLSCGNETVLDHFVRIHASQYTPLDESSIPTGDILPVRDTPFDFLSSRKIGENINKVQPGYDNNYVINQEGHEKNPVAELYHAGSGRMVEVFSTEPGVQFYTGNFLDGSLKGKNGIIYDKHMGVCLETQHFPDSPNNKEFPSTILAPGEPYSQTTVYKFDIKY